MNVDESAVTLVDDETSWVDLASRVLSKRETPFAHFLTFQDALPYLATRRMDSLLVNSALNPGWDHLQRAIWNGYASKVLIVSNTHSLSLAIEAFRRGIDYADKPFAEEGIVELLDRLNMSNRGRYADSIQVLIVEDQVKWQKVLSGALSGMPRLKATVAGSYSEATAAITSNHFHIIVTDIRLIDSDRTNIDGLVLLKDVHESQSNTIVIVTSAFASVELARDAMFKYHAFDFFLKNPDIGYFELDRFQEAIRQAVQQILLHMCVV